MKVFIWQSVGECSDSYHSDGGVVVFADNLREARALANAEEGCNIRTHEKPDDVRIVKDGKKVVYIMPNAGCC